MWMPNVFISSETGSQWRTILGHPQLIECMGICILSLAHKSEQRGFDVIWILWKTDQEIFLQIQPGYVPLDVLCLEFFPGFFWFFWGGSVGQIIYREYIVFRGSNISCSLAISMPRSYYNECTAVLQKASSGRHSWMILVKFKQQQQKYS